MFRTRMLPSMAGLHRYSELSQPTPNPPTRMHWCLLESVFFVILISSTSISEDSNHVHLKFHQRRFKEHDFRDFMKGKNGFFDLESQLLKNDLICGVLTTRADKDSVHYESYCYAYNMSEDDLSLLHIDWERIELHGKFDFTGIFCISPQIYGVEVVAREKRFESNQRLLFIWNSKTEQVKFQHHQWGNLGSFAQHFYKVLDACKLFHQNPQQDLSIDSKSKIPLPFAKLAISKDGNNLAVDIPDFAFRIKYPTFLSRFQMATPVEASDGKLSGFIIMTSLIDEMYPRIEFDDRKMIRHFSLNGSLLWEKSNSELEEIFGTEIYAIATATQPISDEQITIVVTPKDAKNDHSLRYFGVIEKLSGAVVKTGKIKSSSDIVPLIASQDAKRFWIESDSYNIESGLNEDRLGDGEINVPFGINEDDVIYSTAYSHKTILKIKPPWKEPQVVLRLD